MSLIPSERLNGHDPYAYLKDVLTSLRHSEQVKSISYCRISGCPLKHEVDRAESYGLGEMLSKPATFEFDDQMFLENRAC